MTPKGFFIAGTDTGVGKTVLAGALIKALRARNIQAAGMKPVETGCSRVGGILYPSDGMFLKKMARMDEPINRITPCCFEAPVAPLVASELDNSEVDIESIHEAFAGLMRIYGTVIVEGIGGILVPIRRDYFVIDLMKELDLPLVVVCSPSLGTLNHTLLTVTYAMQQGVPVSGVVINFSKPSDGSLAEQTNPAVLKKLSPVPVIGIFPYLQNITEETLESAALKHLDIDVLLREAT